MRVGIHFLVTLLAAVMQGQASAQLMTYDGCVDAAGRPVASEMDFVVPQVAVSRLERGLPVIRYNPQALPRLKPKTRLFFYAHECAHHALGDAIGADHPLQREQQADCWGIVTLVRSGLISQSDDVPEIQSDLVFSSDDWSHLPGPPRTFNLDACFRSALKMPPAGPPSGSQLNWNGCIRVCAERLRQCQTGCRGEACDRLCVTPYRQCEEQCSSRFPP